MMRLILPFLVFSSLVIAQDSTQEAIILNQELQFLEESAEASAAIVTEQSVSPREDIAPIESLERTYFGEASEDAVSNRTSAPKRRGF